MAKPTTIKIRLNSTAGTGHFYVTKKNSRTMTEKMVVKKYLSPKSVDKYVNYGGTNYILITLNPVLTVAFNLLTLHRCNILQFQCIPV